MLFTARRNADDDDEQENYASQSVAAIIMMVFQYSEDPGESLSQYMSVLSVFTSVFCLFRSTESCCIRICLGTRPNLKHCVLLPYSISVKNFVKERNWNHV
jgi:hypothetical protein